MLTVLDLRAERFDLSRLPRPARPGEEERAIVADILDRVREGGDQAVLDLTERFDGVRPVSLEVPPAELDRALRELEPGLRSALEHAARAISAFYEHERVDVGQFERDGIEIVTRRQPVQRAGVYAPGGRAPYPSSVLMAAVPARVAGVEEVVVVSPPESTTGRVADVTLAAARIAGVDRCFAVGGAQAIAALAVGTETVPAVDVICGPGNRWVAQAERLVVEQGLVSIPPGFAGPSEVVVIADESVPSDWAAIDLAVQAEHGPDGLAWLVTWSEGYARSVREALERVVSSATRSAEITSTLASHGYVALVDDPGRAIEVANQIAPEHLELLSDEAAKRADEVRNAGAVFLGPYAPASVGDYVAGPSHILPTASSARFAGALRVDDFCKSLHLVTVTPEGLLNAAGPVSTIGDAEGLGVHAESVRMRVESARSAREPRSRRPT